MRPPPGSSDVSEVLRTLSRPCSPRFFPELRVRGARVCADISPGPAPRWDGAQGRALPIPAPLVGREFGFPFVGPSRTPPPPKSGQSSVSCAWGPGSTGRPFRCWRPSLFRAGWRSGQTPGGIPSRVARCWAAWTPGRTGCYRIRWKPGDRSRGAALSRYPARLPAPRPSPASFPHPAAARGGGAAEPLGLKAGGFTS